MKRNGFTLIELLVVVAIIGILAAVGVVAYNGYTSAAKVNTAKANLKTISSWLSAESTKVCSAKEGGGKNGMFFEAGNNKTFIRCTDDGTSIAYAASQYFHKNLIFKNPYTGENAILAYQMVETSQLMKFDEEAVPDARFTYDLSPMSVVVNRKGKKWYEFITSICAIIGGTFTVVSLFNSFLGVLFKAKRI